MDFTYLNNENDDQPKEVNLINFERRQRQLLNELGMKRVSKFLFNQFIIFDKIYLSYSECEWNVVGRQIC